MIYLIANGPMQTTAAFAAVSTGTSIKTMLQVKPGTTQYLTIIEWGFSYDVALTTAPKIELIETDVAATVTASVANDITKVDAAALGAGDPTTNLIAVGTTSTGYTASGEGTITAVRNLDGPVFAATNVFAKQFPLGQEPVIQPSKFGRVRVTFGTAVNFYCYMKVSA